ncbi:hypothetical protein BHM03_00024441 [Ensete ventricosum]|nr:hypothetical protein BHM03_00024441 [Ensete ventricosum]
MRQLHYSQTPKLATSVHLLVSCTNIVGEVHIPLHAAGYNSVSISPHWSSSFPVLNKANSPRDSPFQGTSTAMEEPLLSSPTTTTSSSLATTPAVLIRVTAILTLVAISLWANHEASMSVDISVGNSADGSRAGRLFDLKFASNGRVHRIIHHASQFVEKVLYPDVRYPRKPINHITLRLASDDLPFLTSVSPGFGAGDYTIHLSPILMSAADANAALAAAVHRAVAKLWLWDGQRTAPEPLLEAAAEYLAMAAIFGSRPNIAYAVALESNETCWSAEFLHYCEAKRTGFVAGLNRGMQERWTELTADEAFGSPVRKVCAAYRSASPGRIMESSNSTTDSVEARLSI